MKLLRSLGALAAAALLTVSGVSGCSNNAPEQTGQDDRRPDGESRSGSPQGNDGDLTIAVVTHGQAGDAFWDIVKSGAEQAGKDQGVTVTYAGDGEPARQRQLIDNAVARGVDGLVVSMANPDGVRGSVEAAVDKGIPVVTINSGLERSAEFGAITHVGQSEELAGEAAGERLQDEGLSKVICVVHEAGNVGLEQRCQGAR